MCVQVRLCKVEYCHYWQKHANTEPKLLLFFFLQLSGQRRKEQQNVQYGPRQTSVWIYVHAKVSSRDLRLILCPVFTVQLTFASRWQQTPNHDWGQSLSKWSFSLGRHCASSSSFLWLFYFFLSSFIKYYILAENVPTLVRLWLFCHLYFLWLSVKDR